MYLIQKAASGSWIPLWSEGIKVSMNPPCTDETRVKLEVGDIVKVTRWKRYVFHSYSVRIVMFGKM